MSQKFIPYRSSKKQRIAALNADIDTEISALQTVYSNLAGESADPAIAASTDKAVLLAAIAAAFKPIPDPVAETPSSGNNFIIVYANGSAAANAAELHAAYTAAKSNSFRQPTNRMSILVHPGIFDFTASGPLLIDTNYIDVHSINGERELIFQGEGDVIICTAADFRLTGIIANNKPFKLQSDGSDYIIKNCKGGDYSFGTPYPSDQLHL